jgi:hypothetical protein
VSLEEFKKELSKFHDWFNSLSKEEVTPEEEEEWQRLEKQSNMSK